MNRISQILREQFDTTAISAQVVEFNAFNMDGEPIKARHLIVLDNQDRFMFIVTHAESEKYISPDGFVDYDRIYHDFILADETTAAVAEIAVAQN
jgi:hypothetical protein